MLSDDVRSSIYACVFTFLGALGYSAFAPENNSLERFVNNVKGEVKERVERVNSFFPSGVDDKVFSLNDFFEGNSLKEDYSKKESFHGSDLESKISFSERDSEYLKRAQRVFDSSRVPVLMFHRFAENEDRYTVSPSNFRKLLEELYLNDFYSVTLEEFATGDFSGVPVGKKPVLLTFDDASAGQFRMRSDGSICDRSAVGILEDFYNSYDFGRGGVFFSNYGERNNFSLPFGQDEWASDKVKFLVDNGYSFESHTVYHDDNTWASKNNIWEQFVISSALEKHLMGEERFNNREIRAFAHTYGARPRIGEVFNYLVDKYDLVFDAWGGASTHPLSSVFDHSSVTRIEMTYHTRRLVLGAPRVYFVTPETNRSYELRAKVKEVGGFSDWPSFSQVEEFVDERTVTEPVIFSDFRGTY